MGPLETRIWELYDHRIIIGLSIPVGGTVAFVTDKTLLDIVREVSSPVMPGQIVYANYGTLFPLIRNGIERIDLVSDSSKAKDDTIKWEDYQAAWYFITNAPPLFGSNQSSMPSSLPTGAIYYVPLPPLVGSASAGSANTGLTNAQSGVYTPPSTADIYRRSDVKLVAMEEQTETACNHKWVDIGFNHSKMVCYHCGIDKP